MNAMQYFTLFVYNFATLTKELSSAFRPFYLYLLRLGIHHKIEFLNQNYFQWFYFILNLLGFKSEVRFLRFVDLFKFNLLLNVSIVIISFLFFNFRAFTIILILATVKPSYSISLSWLNSYCRFELLSFKLTYIELQWFISSFYSM